MKHKLYNYLINFMKLSIISGLVISLSGCIFALPPAIQLASLALDGVSYATTGKTVADHAISTLTAQDCSMSRILKGDDICSKIPTEIAMLPDGSVAPDATAVARTIKSAQNDAAFQAFSATKSDGIQDSDEILNLSDMNALDRQAAAEPML